MTVTSPRGRIRAEVIDNMSMPELRELVSRVEEAIESGHIVDEDTLEEYVGEVIWIRPDDEGKEGSDR